MMNPKTNSSTPIVLKYCAISTSGDLYQRVSIGGKTYSHLIDLRTGLGLTSRRTASVMLPTAKLTDPLATDPLATAACLAEDPRALFKNYPEASIRVVYEDQDKAPITTGLFEK